MAHIFLYGPPGSGKTTLGKRLAASLQWPFVDLDEAIECKEGTPIPRIMEQRGESGFREAETAVLRGVINRQASVIALGGGALLREENRALAEDHGRIICLQADMAVLQRRLQADQNPRPLLAGDPEAKLSALLAGRASHYDSFDEQFDANQGPDELIWKLQAAIGRFHLTAMGSYDILVEPESLNRLDEILREQRLARTIVVTDENVAKLHAAPVLDAIQRLGCDPKVTVIAAGESCKTLETVSSLWRAFLQAGLDRKSTVIALGGGVVGDLAGFAASTFMRGIPWICLPTTLLSMVDASIGGKTGFDLAEGKNLIGSFHAPQLVLMDPAVLETLHEVEFHAGLAEVIKHGVIADPQLFEWCAHGASRVREHLPDILRRAVAVKARIIEADPYEKAERAALNLGHTVGHAVEVVSRFGIRHGDAVAMGIVAEAMLAERLSIARQGLAGDIGSVLSQLGLPTSIPEDLPRDEIIRAMQHDKKKAAGVVRFTLPAEIGRVIIDVEVGDLQSVFEEGKR